MPTIEISEQVAATPQEFFDATLAVNQIPGYVEWHPAFVGTGLRILRLTEGAGTTFEFALQGTGATGHAEVVEYALSRTLSPALVAQYQTQLPDRQLLAAKLHEFYALSAPEATTSKRPRKRRTP